MNERSETATAQCEPVPPGRRTAVQSASRWALVLAVAACVPCGCGPQPGTRVLTTVGGIRSLRPADAERGHPVRLRGVTTYYHAASNSLILQAGDEGVVVDAAKMPVPVSRGREVSIEGRTGIRESSAIVIGRR